MRTKCTGAHKPPPAHLNPNAAPSSQQHFSVDRARVQRVGDHGASSVRQHARKAQREDLVAQLAGAVGAVSTVEQLCFFRGGRGWSGDKA